MKREGGLSQPEKKNYYYISSVERFKAELPDILTDLEKSLIFLEDNKQKLADEKQFMLLNEAFRAAEVFNLFLQELKGSVADKEHFNKALYALGKSSFQEIAVQDMLESFREVLSILRKESGEIVAWVEPRLKDHKVKAKYGKFLICIKDLRDYLVIAVAVIQDDHWREMSNKMLFKGLLLEWRRAHSKVKAYKNVKKEGSVPSKRELIDVKPSLSAKETGEGQLKKKMIVLKPVKKGEPPLYPEWSLDMLSEKSRSGASASGSFKETGGRKSEGRDFAAYAESVKQKLMSIPVVNDALLESALHQSLPEQIDKALENLQGREKLFVLNLIVFFIDDVVLGRKFFIMDRIDNELADFFIDETDLGVRPKSADYLVDEMNVVKRLLMALKES